MSAWYTFEKQSASGFCDESGNGNDAGAYGDVLSIKDTPCGGAVRLCGFCGYLEMPPKSLNGLDEFSLEMWFMIDSKNYWERAFDFGREENGRITGYIFFAPAARRVVLSKIGHYSQETVIEIGSGIAMEGWTHFVFEMRNGAIFVYINGRLCAAHWDDSISMKDYDGLNRLYFGKSQYKNDPYLCGLFGEIQLYGMLLSSKEIHDRYISGLGRMAEIEIQGLTLSQTERLTRNISLPRHLPESGAILNWSSSNKAAVSDSGEIHRPRSGADDARAVLTAYVDGTNAVKSFEVSVAAEFTDGEKVLFDMEKLCLGADLNALTHDLLLPEKGEEGSDISWTAEGAVDNTGHISRPALGCKAAEAFLNARISCGKAAMEKKFIIRVLPAEKSEGYLFVYFTGNNMNEERLHYAVTRDCYHFTQLNGGRHVLRQTKGTKCLRDPFVIHGVDGYYYLIATDMQSSKGWDSNRGIITWKSADLINWTDETVIDIAGKFPSTVGADRIWAPQAIYDADRKEYMIYFAVRVHEENPYSIAEGLSTEETHMWYAYTKDFKALSSEPRLLFKPKHGQGIDGDIYFKDGTYYMYYKDESNARIKLTTAKNSCGPYSEELEMETHIGMGLEGVCVYKVLNEERWLMIADAYGANRYVMEESTDMLHFKPVNEEKYEFRGFHPRHGHIVPVSGRQMSALIEKFGVNK